MAYTDKAAYRAARTRWREANPEKHRASQAAYDARTRQQKRERENEKHFRFQAWEVARITNSEFWSLTMLTSKQLAAPDFVFVLHGQRRKENLQEPLPRW